jgi:hypothetical protein
MRVAFIAVCLLALATAKKPLVQTVEIDGIPKVNNDHTNDRIPKATKPQGNIAPTDAPVADVGRCCGLARHILLHLTLARHILLHLTLGSAGQIY